MNRVFDIILPFDPRKSDLYFDTAPQRQSSSWEMTSRRSLVVRQGRLSTQTYFNAFPATWWSTMTSARTVHLIANVDGHGTLTVKRSNGAGKDTTLSTHDIEGTTAIDAQVPLAQFADGGFCWFELEAKQDGIILEEAWWAVEGTPLRDGNATIAMTTFNKPSYVIDSLTQLSQDAGALSVLDAIVVVDQGTQHVRDEQRFNEVEKSLGGQLRIIEQPNLGGSGGFSRGMLTALDNGSDGVLLLDDDVELEPESIRRAVWFSRFTKEPTIIGGHMFDLNNPTVLHAFSEIVDRNSFNWGPDEPENSRHDLSLKPMSQSPYLHHVHHADYTGWWMCLIPCDVLRSIGLSLPFFIKWDDAEYGLRAQEAGYTTVTLPGVALWHIAWIEKPDWADWQSYFHIRNQTIAALMHSDRPGIVLMRKSGLTDIMHLISMRYTTIDLRHQAIRDVAKGPETLWSSLATAAPKMRELISTATERTGFDTRNPPEPADPIPVTKPKPSKIERVFVALKQIPRHWMTKPDQESLIRPDIEVPTLFAKWWIMSDHDSVLVRDKDANNGDVEWFKRDRSRFRSQIRRSRRLNRLLLRKWPDLKTRYQAAMTELVGIEAWRSYFDGQSKS